MKVKNPHSLALCGFSRSGGPEGTPTQTVYAAAATSLSTSGRISAIEISVLAAREGERRPCSHSCRVRTETPSKPANCDWLSPDLIRAETTGETSTLVPFLAIISLTDLRNSAAISREDSKESSASSVNGFFDFIFHLPQNLARNGIEFRFRIHEQQPDLTFCQAVKVNNTNATRLPRSSTCPANLANTTRLANDITRLGILCQPRCKLASFILSPVMAPKTGKSGSFYNREHVRLYVKDV